MLIIHIYECGLYEKCTCKKISTSSIASDNRHELLDSIQVPDPVSSESKEIGIYPPGHEMYEKAKNVRV